MYARKAYFSLNPQLNIFIIFLPLQICNSR